MAIVSSKDYILRNRAVLIQSEKDYQYFCKVLKSNVNYKNIGYGYVKDAWEFCMFDENNDEFYLISNRDVKIDEVAEGKVYIDGKKLIDSNEFIRALQ